MGGAGCHRDDAAGRIAPAGHHRPCRGVAQVQRRIDVDGDLVVEALEVELGHPAVRAGPGVAHEQVDGALDLLEPGGDVAAPVGAGEVGRQDLDVGAVALGHVQRELPQARLAAGDHDEVAAPRGELPGEGAADPGGGPGDERTGERRHALATRVGGLRSGVADSLHVGEGVAQVGQPAALVGADEAHAPRQRVAATARHPGIDQRVEHEALADPQPGHGGQAQHREEDALIADAHTPRDLAAEPALRVAGDAHAELAGLLAEGARLGAGAPAPGEPPDDQHLVAVGDDLRRPVEPRVRDVLLEEPGDRVHATITPLPGG